MHVCTHVLVKLVCVTINKVQWFSSSFCQSCEFRAQKGAINEKSTLAGVAFTRHALLGLGLFYPTDPPHRIHFARTLRQVLGRRFCHHHNKVYHLHADNRWE